MNIVARINGRQRHDTLPMTRLKRLLAPGALQGLLGEASEILRLGSAHIETVKINRVHPRSDGGFVLDVISAPGRQQLFIEVVADDIGEAEKKIRHRHLKQQERLGQVMPLHLHTDRTTGSIVRLKGEDELIDGLVAVTRSDCGMPGFDFSRSEPKLLAHRLNRRAVIMLENLDGARMVWKTYKKSSQKAQAAVVLHELLISTAFGESSPVRVPDVLGQSQRWPGYLMKSVDGVAVGDLKGSARCNGMSLAGLALGRLHGLPLRLQTHHSLEEELVLLQSWVDLTSSLFPPRAATLAKAFAHVARLLSDTADLTADCIVHRDFHEGQVIVAGIRATLIDFDTACNGEPALDIGNFLAHLDHSALSTGISTEDDAAAFIKAYQSTTASVSDARVRAHRAATLLRLSCIHALPLRGETVANALIDKALAQ